MAVPVAAACPDTEKRDPYAAPRSAEELEMLDGARVRAFVHQQMGTGFRSEDRDDAASEIIEKLVKNEVWQQYKANFTSEHTGKPVTWKYFLGNKIVLYSRGMREKYGRIQGREPMWMDSRVGDGSSTWGEVFGGGTTDEIPSLVDDDSFEVLRDWLALHPAGPAPCSLLALLDELADRMRSGESVSRLALSRRFGISQAMAGEVMLALKDALREAVTQKGEVHRFEVNGVPVTAADLRTAVDRLRDSRGNRVSPALEGHPLGGMTTKEYIVLGKKELKAHPECKVPKGTREANHSSQTKVALIHLFERMLTEAGAPEPEVPPTPDEVLESELWKLGLTGLGAEQVDRIKAVAKRAFASA